MLGLLAAVELMPGPVSVRGSTVFAHLLAGYLWAQVACPLLMRGL